jgi:hypothetical protein
MRKDYPAARQGKRRGPPIDAAIAQDYEQVVPRRVVYESWFS